jgi:2-dehydro-3-deoxy-L-rhamnonate dehydrogenase (NAD+)
MATPAPTVVTGAARGIGAAVARRFVADGREVLLVDLDDGVEATAGSIGARATALRLDVTNPDAWEDALEPYPRIGGLIACAGVLGEAVPVAELDVDAWRKVLEINLTGVFVSCRAVIPRMAAGGGGAIVALASIAGKEGNALQAAYSASKGGVIALTKSLAKEVVGDGITVNCIAPTVIEGPFSEQMTDEMKEALLAKIPMRRFGRAEEVAAMASWISSPECSFTTGVCFDLTGGRATY